MKVRISVSNAGATAEVLADLPPDATPDEVRNAVRTHAAALRSGLADSGHAPAGADESAEDDHLRPRGGAGARGDRDESPRDGRQLLAWAGDRNLKKRVYELGKAWRLPERVLSWGGDDARAVYEELLREADRRPIAVPNGHARARP